MSSITFTIRKMKDAVAEIINFMHLYYQKVDVDNSIREMLQHFFDKLDRRLWVCIEYPYVDKVYRDSFYSYFASKHNSYYRDCIRVSFFTGTISFEDFRSKTGQQLLQKKFVGYLVVRPTFAFPIGRSLLNKKAFVNHEYITCTHTGNVSVNGVKLNVEGFPHSSQDTESISCAETTIWSMMEYFGNRYPDYKPTYPSHIIAVLNRFSKQRLLPSNGLTVDQISFALKEFGFGTNIYSREEAYDDDTEDNIRNIIGYYIESGIPVIAAMENEYVGHAIVIIGHDTDTTPNFSKVKKRPFTFKSKKTDYIDYTDIPKKYVISDDNLAPYRTVDLKKPAANYTDSIEFADCTIKSIVVPLYKKVYLEVIKAKQLALAILQDKDFGYPFKKGFIFRFFLTSSRSFKDHIATLDTLIGDQKNYLILTKMPKFIWCGEIYEQADFQTGKAAGLLVLDATEANQVWIDSLIFAGYHDRIILKDQEEFVTLPQKLNLYYRFKNNLN